MSRTSRTQDEWIALRCQSGEPSGFEDLVAVMERPLLYYASKLAGNVEAGMDILQDAWVKAFRDMRRLKDPGSLRPWLYRITHGIAVDRIRRDFSRERAEEVHLEAFQETPEPSFVSLACFWFLFGMVYLVPHSINRSKLDILKEVKQVQVQLLELQALIRKDDPPTP